MSNEYYRITIQRLKVKKLNSNYFFLSHFTTKLGFEPLVKFIKNKTIRHLWFKLRQKVCAGVHVRERVTFFQKSLLKNFIFIDKQTNNIWANIRKKQNALFIENFFICSYHFFRSSIIFAVNWFGTQSAKILSPQSSQSKIFFSQTERERDRRKREIVKTDRFRKRAVRK